MQDVEAQGGASSFPKNYVMEADNDLRNERKVEKLVLCIGPSTCSFVLHHRTVQGKIVLDDPALA